MNLLKNRKRTVFLYIAVCSLLTLLSLIFLFYNIWEAHVVLFIGSVFNGLYLFVLLNWGKNVQSKTAVNRPASMVGFTIIRSLLQILSLFLSALCIYLIPSKIFVGDIEKYKYFLILLDLVPYGLAMILCLLYSKKED